MRAVLLDGAGRHDHRVVAFEKGFDLGIRHLAEKTVGGFIAADYMTSFVPVPVPRSGSSVQLN